MPTSSKTISFGTRIETRFNRARERAKKYWQDEASSICNERPVKCRPKASRDAAASDNKQGSDRDAQRSDWLNKEGPAAPLPYFGGKKSQAPWIIDHFPYHDMYAEPFAGMANVLLRKHPSKMEVYNDLNGRVTNFFRVLQDKDQFDELVRLCWMTPVSRPEFERLCDEVATDDPAREAWKFLVLGRQSRGGFGAGDVSKKDWAVGTRPRREVPEQISKLLTAIDGLDDVASRIREHVTIECMPAVKLIKKYDKYHNPDGVGIKRRIVLQYLDPPYPPETRHGGKAATYSMEMTRDDHVELLETIRECKSHVIISSYPSELYDGMLSDWNRDELQVKAQTSNSGQKRTEVIWMNF